MQNKAVNGFVAGDVDDALKGVYLPPEYRVRAELLDQDLVKLHDVEGLILDGDIVHNVEQPLQGGATLKFLAQPRGLSSFASFLTTQARLFHLRMNETAGSSAADFTGNGRNFTITATVTFSQAALGLGDVADNAFKLNGTTARLDIAYASWMNVGTFTIAGAWRGTGVNQTLIDRDDGTTNRVFRVGVDANGFLFAQINFTSGSPANKTFTSTALINDGNPHLIHVRYDKSTLQIFVDGRRVLKTTETRTVSQPTAQGIRIGATGAGANFSSGTFDEWGMVARALSPAEIRSEYQAWSGQIDELLYDKERGDRLRIYFGVRMPAAGTDGEAWAEWPQKTLVMATPELTAGETASTWSVTCQDLTRPLADDTFTARWTVGAAVNYITGTNGILAIAQSAGFDTSGWSVTATTSLTAAAVDFEIGTSKLDAINQMLGFINYRPLRFAGNGTGIIEPNVLDKDLAVADSFATDEYSIIGAEDITLEIAQRAVPNQVVVFNGNPDADAFTVTATNNKVNSPTSTVNLQSTNGIAFQVDAPDSGKGQEIANQILSDQTARFAQRIALKMLVYPIFEHRDRVHLNLDAPAVNADFIVLEWRLPLDPLQKMSLTFLGVVDVI